MRQPCRKFSQRDHLFVLQITRRKHASTINHRVDQSRSDLATLAHHLRKMLTRYSENLRGLLGARISRRSHETRIRQHTRNISRTPLNEFGWPRTTINEQSHSPGKNDVKEPHRIT